MEKISIVVPCYNEEEVLDAYYAEIKKIMEFMKDIEFEIIFVDDGSKDNTLTVAKKLNQMDSRCKYISFSRNFGKESAMFAGLKNADGDFVAIMDADLQDPPALLPEMYRILKEEDYDNVATRRVNRAGEPVIRSLLSRAFYKLVNKITEIRLVSGARDYRLMNRKMVDAVLQVGESNRFSKGIFEWVGFKTKWLDFNNVERVAGDTKWSIFQLFKYSLVGITEFSTLPLAAAIFIGSLFTIAAIVMMVIIFIEIKVNNNMVSSWKIITSIVLLLSGIQLVCTGILSNYMLKTYTEAKKRPLYILRETSDEQ